MKISGPYEIAFGMGWEPTKTWWNQDRRAHTYYAGDGEYWIEVAPVSDLDFPGVRGRTRSEPESEQVAMAYLSSNLPFTQIAEVEWITDGCGVNHLIPHPPSKACQGNIAAMLP